MTVADLAVLITSAGLICLGLTLVIDETIKIIFGEVKNNS